MKKYKVAIIGATGFTGVELISILSSHPAFDVTIATARRDAGAFLSDIYPALKGTKADIVLTPVEELNPSKVDIVFLAVPHTSAMGIAEKLLRSHVTVIDLSADFRLKDPQVYQSWYGVAHLAPALLEQAVYALPELTPHEKISSAKLLSCPGCYPTATALAAAPLLGSPSFGADASLIVDAKSGVSGAGRPACATTHYCAIDESVSAYKAAMHQHTPEIEQMLSSVARREVAVTFVPHLIPMKRGLLSTVYIPCHTGTTAQGVYHRYASAYKDKPFVTVLELGQQPRTASVTGSNHAHIGIAYDARTDTAIVTCAIDNLGKGASAQAIQVANISKGIPQTTGLETYRSIV